MNKGDLISKVAEDANLTKAQASDAVNGILDAIKASLKDDDKVAILGFGTFTVVLEEIQEQVSQCRSKLKTLLSSSLAKN